MHEDSLLMRLRKNIEGESGNAIYREYPLVSEDQIITWPGKFQDMSEIVSLERSIGNDKAWQREFMLKIVPEDDQLIFREWIQYYEEIPSDTNDYRYTVTTVDLAISQSESSDYTAIATAHVFGNEKDMKIYILPNPINRRMDFPTTVEEIQKISKLTFMNGRRSSIYIEQVGYQLAAIQHLDKIGVGVKGFKVHGQDKRARLSSVSSLVRFGQVLFPRAGAETLIQQLLYFGVESHDDLVDAFSMLLLIAIEKDHGRPMVMTPELAYLIRGGGGSSYGGQDYYYL